MGKVVLTVNEARAQEGIPPLQGPMGDAPINPSLVGPWMQLTQAPEEDEGEGNPPPPLEEKQPAAKGEPDHAALAQQMAEELAGQGLAKGFGSVVPEIWRPGV